MRRPKRRPFQAGCARCSAPACGRRWLGRGLGPDRAEFASPRYFQGRPSATTAPDPDKADATVAAPYNAALSAATNQGPTHAALKESVAARVAAYRELNGLAADAAVPVDAVTASASGLDPHISVANAELQLPRVARERQLPVAKVQELLRQQVEPARAGPSGRAARERAADEPGAGRSLGRDAAACGGPCRQGPWRAKAKRLRASSWRLRCGCGSPCCSPTLRRRWPRAQPRPGRQPAQHEAQHHRQKLEQANYQSRWHPVGAEELRSGMWVLVEAGDTVPLDGTVIEGVASVDGNAITGESAP
ncbi:Copper-transporting ATPase 1 [Manis javanica]|nr:Copper-transporting ATPase 1 [Manis javanica]